jgi:signal transduction histidine kinase
VLFVIRTRWFVVGTIAIVAAIGALVYSDETERSEAALDDLGERQAEVARAAARDDLHSLEQRETIVLTGSAGDMRTLAHMAVPMEIQVVVDGAISRGETSLRIAPRLAAQIGLPERTAMIGIAHADDGRIVAVATSAEHQRDRDRLGRRRVLLATLLAAGVVSAFAAIVWRKQRSEAELARNLAVAETARSRDAELARLNRAATMAALGSGVAHELATPLGVIIGRAEQLKARVGGDDRAAKNVQAILDQADHIDQVVRGLLGLARGAPVALSPISPDSVVTSAAELVAHRFQRANVHLVPAVDASLPAMRCEPSLFKHAIVNLLLNACDASPAGSTVHLDVHATATEIELVVTDDGEGIAPADAARAVEPFFTTKPAGKGSGLGLAIANEIAKTHRGTLEIAPRQPRGTRASIRIPIAGGAA